MSLLDKVTKLEKRLEKLAERDDVAPEPVEIRRAILDEVEEHVTPGPRSKRVFPFNRVSVAIVAPDARRRTEIDAVLGGERGLAAAIADRLREAGCDPVAGLEAHVRYARRAAAGQPLSRPITLVCTKADAPPAVPAPLRAGTAQVVVLTGTGTRKSYPLAGERTNIGRTAEVLDREHRVVRRNQVVFPERDNPVNATVSRAQAHIRQAGDGEYRLYDDRSTHGTRVFRKGRTIALPSGSPRGVRLQPGDEIYFGQASVRFEVKTG